MSHCRQRIVEGLEKLGETGQFQSLADAVRHVRQHNLAAIVFLAVALGGKQGAEARAGHVLQRRHIYNQFILPAFVRGFKRARHLGGGGAIHAAFDRDQIAVFEFLG